MYSPCLVALHLTLFFVFRPPFSSPQDSNRFGCTVNGNFVDDRWLLTDTNYHSVSYMIMLIGHLSFFACCCWQALKYIILGAFRGATESKTGVSRKCIFGSFLQCCDCVLRHRLIVTTDLILCQYWLSELLILTMNWKSGGHFAHLTVELCTVIFSLQSSRDWFW